MFTATTFLLNLPPLTSVFTTYYVPHNIPFNHNSKQENNNGICITASVRKHHITSHHQTSPKANTIQEFKFRTTRKKKIIFETPPESISKLIDIDSNIDIYTNTNTIKTVSNTGTGTDIISLSSQTFGRLKHPSSRRHFEKLV